MKHFPFPVNNHHAWFSSLLTPWCDGVKARLAVPFLRALRKKMAGHPQLPVTRMQEADHSVVPPMNVQYLDHLETVDKNFSDFILRPLPGKTISVEVPWATMSRFELRTYDSA